MNSEKIGIVFTEAGISIPAVAESQISDRMHVHT
jgi:hypothetical protein